MERSLIEVAGSAALEIYGIPSKLGRHSREALDCGRRGDLGLRGRGFGRFLLGDLRGRGGLGPITGRGVDLKFSHPAASQGGSMGQRTAFAR